jgi:putative DNA primase/helicase
METVTTAPKDISDMAHTTGPGQLRELVDAALVHVPLDYPANDAGRARRFIDSLGENLRYVSGLEQWLLWDGHRWVKDQDGGITRLAIEHSRQFMREASGITDHERRTSRLKEALLLGDVAVIRSMLHLARCDGRVVVSAAQLDADPFLLGVENGVVDLRSGEFRAARRSDLITKRAGTRYEAEAPCPLWEKFLDRIMGGNAGLIAYLQALTGYSLTGVTSEQCFAFLYGGGKNGKTVFTHLLYALAGQYAQAAPQSLFTASKHGKEPGADLARLPGVRLLVSCETEQGSRLAESRMKGMTGGDMVVAEAKYCAPFEFQPQFKLWIFGNYRPQIRGTDEGIWRRVRLIPFTVWIPPEERDEHLIPKLEAELPGILRWALEGTRRWLESGMHTPACVEAATAEYRDDEDTLGQFLHTQVVESPRDRVLIGDMYARYLSWCEREGIRHTLQQPDLAKRLRERGLTQGKSNGQRYWAGVSLTDDES